MKLSIDNRADEACAGQGVPRALGPPPGSMKAGSDAGGNARYSRALSMAYALIVDRQSSDHALLAQRCRMARPRPPDLELDLGIYGVEVA